MNPNATNAARSSFQEALKRIDRDTDPIMWNVVNGLSALADALRGIELDIGELKGRS
jgi:hypothetical protein